MAKKLEFQELNEDVTEFFPSYGSLNNSKIKSEKAKKALLAKSLAAAASVGVVALALVPYLICHPISISKTQATISAQVMNLEEGNELSYFVTDYPGLSDVQLLKALEKNPNMGKPFHGEASLTLEGLKAESPYRLVFYGEDPADPEGKPYLVGDYAFRTGEVPVPAPLKWLQELLNPGGVGGDPELPEVPLETTAPAPTTE